jgi:moderate conductance mechanosensitive channel
MDAHLMQWIWLAVTLAGIIIGGVLVVKLFRYEVRWLVRKFSKADAVDPNLQLWIEELSRSARSAIIIIGVILAVVLSLRVLDVPLISPELQAKWQPQAFLSWLMDHGIAIVLTIAVAGLSIRIVHKLISHLALLVRPHDQSPAAHLERAKRVQTVSAILQNLTSFVIIVVAMLMVLAELGVNITPILTSLGVVGVAIGFGAQQLVGDLIAGFFHIFENQIRVGDVAVINGVGGQVEELRLRTTVLRAFDGTVHIFRNGTITTLANMTKDFSYFAMDLPVNYKDDTDRITKLVREVGAELQTDEKLRSFILEPVDVLGVESFTDSAISLRFRMKTLPIKQWEVGREFRRRLKIRLDQEGIEIPVAYHYMLRPEAPRPRTTGI